MMSGSGLIGHETHLADDASSAQLGKRSHLPIGLTHAGRRCAVDEHEQEASLVALPNQEVSGIVIADLHGGRKACSHFVADTGKGTHVEARTRSTSSRREWSTKSSFYAKLA